MSKPLDKVGGRKFALSVMGIISVTILALAGADATAFGALAFIVGAYSGANSYVEGKHARPSGE
jgi:hypothetical protein